MYNYSILKTGLNCLRSFQTYFKRDPLENILEKNSSKIATLVIAGASCGKSTLVSQWINNKQVVWSCYVDTDSNEQIDVLSRKTESWIIGSRFIFKSQFYFLT